MRRWARLSWSAAAVVTSALVSVGAVTTSGSLPRGLYVRVPRSWMGRQPEPGDLVLACAPADDAALARRRGYLGSGPCSAGESGGAALIGKVVLAAAGDEVVLGEDGIEVNGQRVPSSRPLLVDRTGRLLQHYRRRCVQLGRGEVWLYSPHPRSFDSRYFGPAGDGAVIAFLVPVATDGDATSLRRLKALHHAAGGQGCERSG